LKVAVPKIKGGRTEDRRGFVDGILMLLWFSGSHGRGWKYYIAGP
jgi:hypothetical protein